MTYKQLYHLLEAIGADWEFVEEFDDGTHIISIKCHEEKHDETSEEDAA